MEKEMVIDTLRECVTASSNCYLSSRSSEDRSLTRCMVLCRDCIDICKVCISALERNSEHSEQLLTVCEDICRNCAAEASRHDHVNCEECAHVCQHCSEVCSSYLAHVILVRVFN